MMSLPNTAIYIQFHPLVYLVKLHIEMNVADLIAKIVKATNQLNEYRANRYDANATHSGAASHPSRLTPKESRGLPLKRMDSIDLALGLDVACSRSDSTEEPDNDFKHGPDLERGFVGPEKTGAGCFENKRGVLAENSTSIPVIKEH
jgi:hypothetical protein